MGLCAPSMEIDLDVWPLVEELMPLLEEIERIEAIASGKTPATDTDADGQETDQRPEDCEGNDG
jgi:hypothetical protein